MFSKLLTEFIGTFVFLTVILRTGDALAIGLTLAAVIYFGSKVSGGNYNPAVSYMLYLNNKLDLTKLVMYILAQLAGATAALLYYKMA
jgi:aquaporin Z